LWTGRENRKVRGEQWRRPQESGERRSEFVWLSSLLSPLSCSIAAERQWRRPPGLETGIGSGPATSRESTAQPDLVDIFEVSQVVLRPCRALTPVV
jgi:hypothetical protein